jgi:hypothetical protein
MQDSPRFASPHISPNRSLCTIVGIVCISLYHAPLLGQSAAGQSAGSQSAVDFNRDIRPILSDKCFSCHGPDNETREAELRLDQRLAAIARRDEHPAIEPGSPSKSLLIGRITSKDESEVMPPPDSLKVLTTTEIRLLTQWIADGAPYDEHWTFGRLERPSVPVMGDGEGTNPVDQFLREYWRDNGVSQNTPADPLTQVRRLSFDLLGLPPTHEQIQRYQQEPTADTWRAIVDAMLDSPHYGERMAVYWLDLVRYADTVGYHGDQEHAITPYRDYVIQAFNDNKPFDEFTTEQLAGDLLPEPTNEQLIASGYNRLLQTSHEGGVQKQEYLTKYSADRVRNLSAVWLGATVGCAECHDHKYDPYTQRDFYRLAAFFADLDDLKSFQGGNTLPTKREPEIEVLSPIDLALIATVEQQIQQLKSGKSDITGDAPNDVENNAQLATLEARKLELLGRKRRTMISHAVEPRVTRILERGDWMDTSGLEVQPGTPKFMTPAVSVNGRATRLDLARWLTAPDHPQTARVLTNRLWYLFFGAGLSANLDDSGAQGDAPVTPELVDWLAADLISSGWDVKQTIKLIVTSNAYQMSSIPSPKAIGRDPKNRLFTHQNRFRLSAEFIRDNALQVSGLLNIELGGESSRPYQPAGYYAHLNFPTRKYASDATPRQFRRGVYVHWQRQFLHPMLRAFDAPTREECTAGRSRSNTPLAALTLLNDPTFVEAARGLANLTLCEGDLGNSERIGWMWNRVLGRVPDQHETEMLLAYYQQTKERIGKSPGTATEILSIGISPRNESIDSVELAVWTSVARAILNLNETITRN